MCEALIRAGTSISAMTDKSPRSALMMASAQVRLGVRVVVLVRLG